MQHGSQPPCSRGNHVAGTCAKPCISVAVYGEWIKRALLMTVRNLSIVRRSNISWLREMPSSSSVPVRALN